ncbi:MAG: phosphoribosylanthranilate isomerase [Hyphomicrobiaceae bacterium]
MLNSRDIERAVASGANLVGLVGPMPSGPGMLSLEEAARLVRLVPYGVQSVFLSSSMTEQCLARDLRVVRPHTIQIVQHFTRDVHVFLAKAFPGIRRLQVVHVEGPAAVSLIEEYGDAPDGFLLDSGRPAAAELGGTGRVHDWAVSRACVEAAVRPVFLAGGLTAANVADAIRRVRPDGIDVCSGVRTDNRLDRQKLSAFIAQIRGGVDGVK